MHASAAILRTWRSAAATFLTLLLCSICGLDAGKAHAEQSALLEDTLVVTAHRVPTQQLATGTTVSIVERSLIEQRQSVFVTDLLQDLPGVAVSRTAGFGSQTQVRVRGAEANQVLVLIDGVEANDPAGNDEFDFSALTAYDVERIELVRGPQSALWGSDASAGVINITTRNAQDPLSGGGFIEAGSLDTVHGGIRLGASRERSDVMLTGSYFDSTGESSASAGSEKDGYENLTLTLNSHLDTSENARLGFAARYRESTSEIDGFDFSTGLPADADLESEDDLLLLSATAGLSLFDERWDQSLKFTYLDSTRDQYQDRNRESSSAADKFGVYYQSSVRLGTEGDRLNQHLTFALDHERGTFTQRGTASFFGDPNQYQEMDNTGYAAEYLVEPIAGLNLSAAIRYDANDSFDDVTTYRVTSSYLVTSSNTRVRASYGTGQKSPTFIERFGFFPDQFVGNPDLQPEQTKGFDTGLSQMLFGGRVQAEIGYFNERLEDEIDGFVFDATSFLFTADNLDGKSKRQGAELAIDASLREGLVARLSYTYVDSTQAAPGGGRLDEVRRPQHMAALNLNQRLFNGRGSLNLNLSYTGSQTDQYFPPPTFSAQTLRLDDYLLVDLTGSFKLTEQITLYARANNLFDEDHTNVIGFSTPGRGVYAGIRMGLGG